MSLATKQRPTTLKGFYGNKLAISSLKAKCETEMELPHSILITGPSGCGKTTLGRIIATDLKAYNPESDSNFDYIELDSADFRGIDTIRDIRQTMQLAPVNGYNKVYLLDEMHMLSGPAAEALLKALEDTPDHVYFILCTTDPEKLKITLKRRCYSIVLQRLSDNEIIKVIKKAAKTKDRKIPSSVIEKIVDASDGSAGVSLQHLEGLISLSTKKMKSAILATNALEKQVIDLCRALCKKEKWKNITTILQDIKKEDPEKIRRIVLGYCSSVLLSKNDSNIYLIMESFREPFYNIGFPGVVLAVYESLHTGE